MKMKYLNIVCVFFTTIFSFQSLASEMMPAEYNVSTLFNGAIGKSKITMYLTIAGNTVVGKYVYNKYGNVIFINGSKTENGFILSEKINKGSASVNLTKNKDGYTGIWCGDNCLPVNLQSNTIFRNGIVLGVNSKLTDNGGYSLEVISTTGKESVVGDNAIDEPVLEFADINNDGFYDLIVFTDHRPNNGSQDVYLSTEHGYVKDKYLSGENGSLAFNPFKYLIVFNTKDDCCNKYGKIIYELRKGEYIKANTLTYDYSKSVGNTTSGTGVSKDEFEKY